MSVVKATIWVIVIVPAWVLAGMAYAWRYGYQDLGPQLSYTGVMSIRAGMSRGQVIELLGEPLRSERRHDGSESWLYARPCAWKWEGANCLPIALGEGLEMYLSFRDGLLARGGAEFWDIRVWRCDTTACPAEVNEADLRRILPLAKRDA